MTDSGEDSVLRNRTGRVDVSFDNHNNEQFEITDTEASSFDGSGNPDHHHLSQADDSSNATDKIEAERAVFKKARKYLKPGPFYEKIVHLYAERKLLVFFWVHFMGTMVIWAHFALIKFEQQRDTVPEGAPRYWWKVLAPSLEFGSMHAILFQMSLIPITMSRYSIAMLTDSFIDKIVPLNRMLRCHIHLGYVMISIVCLATVFFFAFFGLLCSDGEQDFCDKFTSEIMITGYYIFAVLLIIGGTSYFRHSIPYELFYAIHHIVFLMYIVTIAHTLDVEQRKGMKERSQTFKWFSSTLLFYVCDRAAMYLNHRYRTRLLGSSLVQGGSGSKMIILKLGRPILFRFKPGQYAFLRIGKLDNHWHPFSIASGPDSSQLEFYIEVCGDKSWTCNLWNLLQNEFNLELYVEIMGPYGTSLAKTENHTHIMAIGAGTGIVPILSLFKQHVRDVLKMDPEKHLKEMHEREEKAFLVEKAVERRKGTIAQKATVHCRSKPEELPENTKRDILSKALRSSITRHEELFREDQVNGNMRRIKLGASAATRSIYGIVLLTGMPVFGLTLIALTISWNTIPIDVYPGMVTTLKVLTMLFQGLYAVVSLCVWNAESLLSYIDIVLCIICPFADWYWILVCQDNTVLRPGDITLYSLLTGYMTARVWAKAVMPRHRCWTMRPRNCTTVDKMELIWTTRSAYQVSEILPEILEFWETLVTAWGLKNALKVCQVSIFVTDNDQEACAMLRRELRNNDLFKSGAIHFKRAHFPTLIENHTLDMVCTRRKSSTLLTFCGDPILAGEIRDIKISNDIVASITGNKRHQMEYISESYGGTQTKKATKTEPSDTDIEGSRHLTTRKDKTYFLSRGIDKRSSF